VPGKLPAGSTRLTLASQLVLRELLRAGDRRAFGFEIMAATGLRSGAVYPILARLRKNGWVTAEREDIDPVTEGRPVRTYYRLTDDGRRQAEVLRDLITGPREEKSDDASAIPVKDSP
jgi:PadR family transcriptional regulator PadR